MEAKGEKGKQKGRLWTDGPPPHRTAVLLLHRGQGADGLQ